MVNLLRVDHFFCLKYLKISGGCPTEAFEACAQRRIANALAPMATRSVHRTCFECLGSAQITVSLNNLLPKYIFKSILTAVQLNIGPCHLVLQFMVAR